MIKSIQYLRFVAAILVVYAHSNLQLYGVDAHTTNLGGFGVDIFFVISGFIMPYIIFGGLQREGSMATMSAGSFMWRRVTRIWPMYAVTIIAVTVCCLIVAKGLIKDPTVDLSYFYNIHRAQPKWIVETLTFTHWTRPPLLTIGWTLQMEFIFYVAITAVLLARIKTFEGIESALLAIFFGALCLASKSAIAAVFASPIIFEFFLGMFLYRLASKEVLLNKYLALLVATLSIPLFLVIDFGGLIALTGNYARPLAWGVPAFLLVWSMLSLESALPNSRLLLLLGDSSYSLYLSHGVFSPWFSFFWVSHELTGISVAIFLLIYLVCCQIIGVLAHLYIEMPINNFIRSRTGKLKKCDTA